MTTFSMHVLINDVISSYSYILWDGRHHVEVKVLENGIENLVDYMVITI